MRRYPLVLACLLLLALPAPASAVDWDAFETPSAPRAVAMAADGALWYTADGGVIGRRAPNGVIEEWDDDDVGSARDIAIAPNGFVWFTDDAGNKVWRIDPTTEEFTFRNLIGSPFGIAYSDGSMWVTRNTGSLISRFDASTGAPIGLPIATAAGAPRDIAADREGNLWFLTETNRVAKLAGIVETSQAIGDGDGEIVLGPDGAMWFTEPAEGTIGRVNAAAVLTEYALPTGTDGPRGIAAGPDNALWFTEADSNRVSRMTTGGTVTRWLTPGPKDGSVLTVAEEGTPQGIVSDGDDRLWFADAGSSSVGYITAEVGPQGPPGAPGAPGDDGDDGEDGAPGPTGATGAQGATGLPGALGATGPQGPAGLRGPRGRRGPAAKPPRVRCGTPRARRRVRCRVIVGGGESRAALRLRLSRRGALYATGAGIARTRRTNVRLHPLRRLRPGRYTLLVVVGDSVRVKVPVRIR